MSSFVVLAAAAREGEYGSWRGHRPTDGEWEPPTRSFRISLDPSSAVFFRCRDPSASLAMASGFTGVTSGEWESSETIPPTDREGVDHERPATLHPSFSSPIFFVPLSSPPIPSGVHNGGEVPVTRCGAGEGVMVVGAYIPAPRWSPFSGLRSSRPSDTVVSSVGRGETILGDRRSAACEASWVVVVAVLTGCFRPFEAGEVEDDGRCPRLAGDKGALEEGESESCRARGVARPVRAERTSFPPLPPSPSAIEDDGASARVPIQPARVVLVEGVAWGAGDFVAGCRSRRGAAVVEVLAGAVMCDGLPRRSAVPFPFGVRGPARRDGG